MLLLLLNRPVSAVVTATAALTEANDTIAAAAAVKIAATAALTEAGDTLAAAAVLPVTATAALTEGADTLAATAAIGAVITATAALTEASDTLSAAAALTVAATATLTEAGDSLAASAVLPVTAAAALSEAGDTLSAAAALPVTATVNVTEAADSLAAAASVGTAGITASAALAEAADSLAGTATVTGSGIAAPSADPAITAAYRRALARTGVAVSCTFKRLTGFAPANVSVTTATVLAIVRDYQPDITAPREQGYASARMGGLTEGDRMVIVMAADLSNAGFPLPLRKNDRLVLVATGDELNITDVDANKRAAAGAIELKAAGVA